MSKEPIDAIFARALLEDIIKEITSKYNATIGYKNYDQFDRCNIRINNMHYAVDINLYENSPAMIEFFVGIDVGILIDIANPNYKQKILQIIETNSERHQLFVNFEI